MGDPDPGRGDLVGAEVTTVAAAPLAVWDVSGNPNRFHGSPHWREASLWAKDHGLEPDHAYRIEFYLVDTAFAKVFRYALNSTGHRFLDPTMDRAAAEEPVMVLLSELPPAHLREGLG